MTNIPKSCTTCQHRIGGGRFYHCALTGHYGSTARTCRDSRCDENFSGWKKRMGVVEKFIFWFKG